MRKVPVEPRQEDLDAAKKRYEEILHEKEEEKKKKTEVI